MSSRPGRHTVVIAAAPGTSEPGECSFVERPDPERPGFLTYADLVSAADCARIDDDAYSAARTWHRRADGSDRFVADGIPFGAATEYATTIALVRYYRAKLVLERLAARCGGEVELRAVGQEWSHAAHALGLTIRLIETGRAVGVPIGLQHATLAERALARVGLRLPNEPAVALVGAPRWFIPYHQAVAGSWATHLVDPGLRVLIAQLRRRRDYSAEWLAEASAPEFGSELVFEPGDHELWPVLSPVVRPLLARLAALARAGAEAVASGVRVAVTTQDVLPATRAYLLGFAAAGGRVVTLEHGIAGSFRHQVWSVAHRLGVWGEPQARYHAERQPGDLQISSVGSARMARFWARAEEKAPRSRWDVLFFGQPTSALSAGNWSADEVRALHLVKDYARRRPGRRIAMKVHPAATSYGGLVPGRGDIQQLTGDALSLIRSASVVAVATSTAGLEAMAAGVPVVELRPGGPVGLPSFIAQSGATAVAKTEDQFEDAAEMLLTGGHERAAAIARGREYALEFVVGIDQPGSSEARLHSVIAAEWGVVGPS